MKSFSKKWCKVLAIAIVLLASIKAVDSINSYITWVQEVIPFSRAAWLTNSPYGLSGCRLPMAKYLLQNRTLIGMSENEVKTLLGFEQDKHCVEGSGDGSTVLVFTIFGRSTEYAEYSVYIKNGRVLKDKLHID